MKTIPTNSRGPTVKPKKISLVKPADHLSIEQRPADESQAIRDHLRLHEGKAKLTRTNPNYGHDHFPRGDNAA